jgi:hypothetical protein
MNRLLVLLPLAFIICSAFAWAGEAGGVESVALTVYNSDLSLIREVRPFTLDQGVQTLLLSEVSGQLKPETVHLSLPHGPAVALLEQNYDYDLVSSDKLLEKFIGKDILLIDDAKGTQKTAKLLSVAGGMVVEIDGQLLLNPPGRIALPADAASGLLLRPTLSWLVQSPEAAQTKAEISYLSGGLSWSADYVLMLSADDKHGGIEGWVTLSNYSGTTYNNAKLKVVAGDVNRVREEMSMKSAAPPAPAAMADGGAGGFQEEAFFEYHLYDLQRPTTIKNNQQKQIGLLTAADVPVKKLFLFDGVNGGDVRVMVQFKNDEQSGMGMPLPAGVVRLFKADSKGQAQFIGEDRIKHTPKDEEVRLYTGNAFDVKGEAVQMEYKDLGHGYSASYKVTLKNHKEKDDVVITVSVPIYGDWSMTTSNFDYVKKDANTAEFQIPVKAGGEAELTYSFKVVWR